MTEIPNGSFFMPADKPSSANTSTSANANTKTEKEPKKEVVYVSKTPEAAVNAAGVVAGTAGMTGGAILGGVVGASKLPGEYVKQIATQDYKKIVSDTFTTFKSTISDAPQFKAFADAVKEAKSPQVSEELANIVNTLSQRLHETFKNNKEAAAVIDKVVDPFINSISLKKNVRSYAGIAGKAGNIRSKVKSPIGQGVLKLLGFNKKTSSIARDVTGNVAEGIAKVVENIRNFTPAEQKAWKEVSKEMFKELEKNPKVNLSTNLARAIKRMIQKPDWITEPFKTLKTTLIDAAKGLNKSLGKAPIKTIGLHSVVGAVACTALSILGWLGLKKTIMKKEVAKAEAAAAA